MRIPAVETLNRNLREALVVTAEVLYLAAGDGLGSQLATLVTGVDASSGTIPTDSFDEVHLERIKIDHLAIHRCIVELRCLLETRSLGYGPNSDSLDSDYIQQEHLDLLELFLSSLPEATFGSFDWGPCRNGTMRDLLLMGQAWHHLIQAVDEGTQGDFAFEPLTATDVALIAGIEVRTLRNLVGPKAKLRTIEQYKRRKTQISERSFAKIDRFDALDWLVRRKDFRFSRLRSGLLTKRVGAIADPIDRGRGALIAALALGHSRQSLASNLNVSEGALRELGDGTARRDLSEQVAHYITKIDHEQASDTAPA